MAEELIGAQTPRILAMADYDFSRGDEAIEFAAKAGIKLDLWQEQILRWSLAVDRNTGMWAHFEVALIVSRQNGKSYLLIALMLACIYLFGDELVIYSAHELDTSKEIFFQLERVIEDNDFLKAEVDKFSHTNGSEGILFKSGARIKFMARTKGRGRGFTADKVIWDEAYNLNNFSVAATLPTLSSRPNPQVWYSSMAPDTALHDCIPLAQVRQRGLAKSDPRLLYMEWSIEVHDPRCGDFCDEHDDPSDPVAWAKANPAYGVRIMPEFIEREMQAMSPTDFLRERLGVGEWASTGTDSWMVIPEEKWKNLVDLKAKPSAPLVFSADITPSQDYGVIACADEDTVEIVEYEPGVDWMVKRICQLDLDWGPTKWIIDSAGPAGALIAPLEAKGVEVYKPSVRNVTAACGNFYAMVMAHKLLRHRDQTPLNVALAGAAKRDLSGAWAWARANKTADISPLVAATNALWGHQAFAPELRERIRKPRYFIDLNPKGTA